MLWISPAAVSSPGMLSFTIMLAVESESDAATVNMSTPWCRMILPRSLRGFFYLVLLLGSVAVLLSYLQQKPAAVDSKQLRRISKVMNLLKMISFEMVLLYQSRSTSNTRKLLLYIIYQCWSAKFYKYFLSIWKLCYIIPWSTISSV